MSPALNGNTALQCFKHDNVVEICNRIMLDFYPGLPHILIFALLIDKIYYVYKYTKEFEQWCMNNTEKLLSYDNSCRSVHVEEL